MLVLLPLPRVVVAAVRPLPLAPKPVAVSRTCVRILEGNLVEVYSPPQVDRIWLYLLQGGYNSMWQDLAALPGLCCVAANARLPPTEAFCDCQAGP